MCTLSFLLSFFFLFLFPVTFFPLFRLAERALCVTMVIWLALSFPCETFSPCLVSCSRVQDPSAAQGKAEALTPSTRSPLLANDDIPRPCCDLQGGSRPQCGAKEKREEVRKVTAKPGDRCTPCALVQGQHAAQEVGVTWRP